MLLILLAGVSLRLSSSSYDASQSHKRISIPALLRGHEPLPVEDHRPDPQGKDSVKEDDDDKTVAEKQLLSDKKFESPDDEDENAISHPKQEVHFRTNAKKKYPYSLKPVENWTVDNYTPLGGGRFDEYKEGDSPYAIDATTREKSDALARSRRVYIRMAAQHVWKAYETYAFGADELMPQTGQGNNKWGGIGITLVDSLDTLWLLGMKEEFNRARDWVRDHLDYNNSKGKVSVFETTIRDLGGLLAAYDWSHDKVFLDKALDLGERLIKAFASNTGIPYGQIDLNQGGPSHIPWAGRAILAEFGTLQIENRYLSKMTGRDEFAKKTERVFEIMNEIKPPNALYPYYVDNQIKGDNPHKLKDGSVAPRITGGTVTFGAMADSFYEYMLKIWIQGGKTEPLYRQMYDESIDSMHKELLHKSTPSGLTYIADMKGKTYDEKMDHLVCFMGGLLGLGAYTDPLGLDSERAQRDLKTARALTYTCYQMYARMKTGISPEFVQFYEGRDFQIGHGAPHFLLRPEAVESFFILNQLTGDPVYREWGWEVFQSIEKYCRTEKGYGALSNVQDTNPRPRDSMESFFIAELLKYLYLLQDPDTEVDVLNKHVFNTEAHPLRIFPLIDAER